MLHSIIALAEVLELKVFRNCPAKGVILESKIEKGKGPMATVLVKEGLLKVGMSLISNTTACKIKGLMDGFEKSVHEVEPSSPIQVVGWKSLPENGALVMEIENEVIYIYLILSIFFL